MTDSERAQLAAYTVRDGLRLVDDVRALGGLEATARALEALVRALAVSTDVEVQG